MLHLDLSRMLEEKGIQNPIQFLIKKGFTRHTSHRLLYNQGEGINFKHLERLCLSLNCSIEDLFIWQNEDTSGFYKDHPLQKLVRTRRKGNIVNKIKELPLDKLDEVHNFIETLTKK